jgi:putative NADH-flavin reductase
MKILLIGATGNIGQHIPQEALGRGYTVTAVQRSPEALKVEHPNLTIIKGDLLNGTVLPALLNGPDVIISAISPVGSHTPEQFKRANQYLIAALDHRTDKRVIIVGNGESRISREDYAAALVDEIENKQFLKQQFSIGY